MFQEILIVGNLGSDPEMRYMPDGTAVSNFSIATNRRWNDQNGEAKEETTWFRVAIWGRRAEAANQYLTKGHKVMVKGRLRPDPNTGGPRLWTRQDGTVAASYEVTGGELLFLTPKNGNETTPSHYDNGTTPSEESEDDVPF